jgi:hypothetical protein
MKLQRNQTFQRLLHDADKGSPKNKFAFSGVEAARIARCEKGE